MDRADSKPYGRSWYAATMLAAPQRPQLGVDLDVDVCVIGGGLAGLTTAREVARHGWSVVLLEAERIAANASGRNTGFVLPGFAAAPESVVARVGLAQTKDLWALAQAGLDYVRDAIRDDAMRGIGAQDGWLHVSKTDDGDALMHLVQLLGELGCEIEGWPADRVRAVLRSERYFHAIHFPRAIHIHPLNYALGLAAAAERDGARIFEETPALAIDLAGVRKRIVTPAARLRADHVVLCGNVQIGALVPQVASALIPITTYVITTGPLGPRLGEAVGYHGAVSDSDLADNHYRIVDGDRLMWSGRATTWRGNPRRYVRTLSADIRKTYPQLGDVTVDYAWSGTLGNTIHRMPQIGELGARVWLASGFGGHGLNTTALAGVLIARAIVEGDQTWKQFTPFELVWAGGVLGRAVTQMYYWARRARDAAAARRARTSDIARRTPALEMTPEVEQARQPTSKPEPRMAPAAARPQQLSQNRPQSIIPSAADVEAMPRSASSRAPIAGSSKRRNPPAAKARAAQPSDDEPAPAAE
jgi:gamma-glutamylputrescine oxidase